jgi:hypothetical protein
VSCHCASSQKLAQHNHPSHTPDAGSAQNQQLLQQTLRTNQILRRLIILKQHIQQLLWNLSHTASLPDPETPTPVLVASYTECRTVSSEIHTNEKGTATAGFLTRAAEFFASCGNDRIEEVMTDNHLSDTHSTAFADATTSIGARHITIRPHCPWQNGKVERFNRTPQTEWAYTKIYTSNSERAQALQQWLHTYNHHRNHSSLSRQPRISRVPPT